MTVGITGAVKRISDAPDKKEAILKELGNKLDSIELTNNQVLVATFIRESKVGSILMPDSWHQEDVYQGKVGLVVKMGPLACINDGEFFASHSDIKEGDWVGYRAGDAWALNVNDVPCRIIVDKQIKLKLNGNDPQIIF
jgi:hypothetical protein